MNADGVDLGYLEIPEHSWTLNRCYFPSKVGGKPSWLSPQKLPAPESMQCSTCATPLAFLLQIYAPSDDKKHSFHRTVFVFCCKTSSCYKAEDSSPIKVLRCNLPRENDYYAYEPPNYDSPASAESSAAISSLCDVCGCLGKKWCSRCRAVKYCGKEHQMIDWKSHKLSCGNTNVSVVDKPNRFLFSEHELVIERQEDCPEKPHEPADIASTSRPPSDKFSEHELERMCSSEREDVTFSEFKEKLSLEPEQVVRYNRGGSPLWCSKDFQPKADDIPSCRCGAKRTFEFQIMPHLLSHLDVDSTVKGPTIDWGTIAVYTCADDCSPDDSAYMSEIAWKQTYDELREETT